MISTNLERLQANNARIKRNIENAYIEAKEKGASLPSVQNSANLAEMIRSIPQGSSEWKPEKDWFDVDRILAEDTEEYEQKAIWLMNDLADVFTMEKGFQNVDKVRMSDGGEYTDFTQVQRHVWDRSKDKECGLGYKTRYVIFYWSGPKFRSTNLGDFRHEILYLIYRNVDFVTVNQNYWFGQLLYSTVALRLIDCKWSASCNLMLALGRLKCVELGISGVRNSAMLSMSNPYWSNLKVQEVYDFFHNEGLESMGYCFSSGGDLIEIDLRSTDGVKNFKHCFATADGLQVIRNLSLRSASDVTNMFMGCYGLRELYVSDIGMSGLSVDGCNFLSRESLLRLKDACYDYSSDMESTHNIKIGAMNIAKLREEELAEWQNKGWTVS